MATAGIHALARADRRQGRVRALETFAVSSISALVFSHSQGALALKVPFTGRVSVTEMVLPLMGSFTTSFV